MTHTRQSDTPAIISLLLLNGLNGVSAFWSVRSMKLEYYVVGGWDEDTRLAGKATFLRMKSELEVVGAIEGESEQREVGRPRHRLLLGAEMGESEKVVAVIEEAARKVSS